MSGLFVSSSMKSFMKEKKGKNDKKRVKEEDSSEGSGVRMSQRQSRRQNSPAPAVDVEDILARLLRHYSKDKKPALYVEVPMTEEEIRFIIYQARTLFRVEPSLLPINKAVSICGDLHGQYTDLLRIFDKAGRPPDTTFLFLGDYVDRGANSIETIVLLLVLKVLYPDKIYMLRGNHEASNVNRVYGFYNECKRRYSVRLWRAFSECFNCLPIAAVVQRKIFCVHGGLSPFLDSLDDIRYIERPTEVPDDGLLCDLLWSDPLMDAQEEWTPNDRGVSYSFSEHAIKVFLRKHDLDLICRAHQVVEHGYEFFGKRRLVTIFSAPNYCNEFDNAAAVMRVDKDLVCSFVIIPALFKLAKEEV